MCEPVTIASLGLSLVGTAVGAYGQFDQSRAQSKAHDIQSKILERAARDAIRRGGKEAGLVRQEASQIIGSQTTMAGASGVALESDVVQAAARQSRALSEADVAMIQANAAREAWGIRHGAQQHRQAASQAIRAGNIAIGTTILTGVGQVGFNVAQALARPGSSTPAPWDQPQPTAVPFWGQGIRQLPRGTRRWPVPR